MSPKKKVNYDERINFVGTFDLKVALLSLAYYRGDRTGYATVARDLLVTALQEEVAKLNRPEMHKYNQIRQAVEAQMTIERQQRAVKV